MTSFIRVFGSLAALALLGAVAWGQEEKKDPPPKPPLIKIEKVRLGFQPYDPLGRAINKPGMWTPALVQVKAGEKPVKGTLVLETNDNEDVGQIVALEFALDANERRTLQTNIRPGNRSAEVKINIEVDNRTFPGNFPSGQWTLDLQSQVILTLGSRIEDLQSALMQFQVPVINPGFEAQGEKGGTWPRFAAFETDVNLLPDHWTGYHGVDVMILSTDRREFVQALSRQADRDRLGAIAQWVRRGGHLVVGVNWTNQGEVAQLFKQPVWQPPVPVLLPDDAGDVDALAVPNLEEVRVWAKTTPKPFLGQEKIKDRKGIRLAQLKPREVATPDWEVLADTGTDHGKRPVITRMAYGRGSITFVAFSLEQPPLSTWEGRFSFWKELVEKLGPTVVQRQGNQDGMGVGARNDDDISATLFTQLDNFDVKVVPFGWVALFILLYILVVGPLDYFLLKYVFQRLEWTWITFPTVVFAVSVAAYFTAYAIKGKDLKINQIDIVDFDLRTHLDEKGQTKRAYAYGQSFFTLLSPRIQNYTIGLEPNPTFWGQGADKKNMGTDMVSWLGPADDRFNGMGRRGSQSFFRRPYHYSKDPVGLEKVPITVWGTKAFMASWEATLPQLPFQADLVYHLNDPHLKISGKLESHLAVDLEDVWLFYRNQAFSVGKTLPGKKAAQVDLKGALGPGVAASDWITYIDEVDKSGRLTSDKGIYNPTPAVKHLLVHKKADITDSMRNHSFRNLDMTWRLQEDKNNPHDTGMREAILYGRVRFRSGEGEALATDETNPAPTQLWLGALPGAASQRPALTGNLNQDTYVRVLLPVRPARK